MFVVCFVLLCFKVLSIKSLSRVNACYVLLESFSFFLYIYFFGKSSSRNNKNFIVKVGEGKKISFPSHYFIITPVEPFFHKWDVKFEPFF